MDKIRTIIVETLDGKEVDILDRCVGKPLLLLFYNNTCMGCTGRALPMAYDYNMRHAHIDVVGIHVNFKNQDISKADIINIFTSKKLPFPIFLDKTRIVYKQFSCDGVPHWILLDENGHVLNSIFGSQEAAQNRLMYALEELME
jgi:peroxiredoxin